MASKNIYWTGLLKRHLFNFPKNSKIFHSQNDLVVTITAKTNKYSKRYVFGGLWSAHITFEPKNIIRLDYLSPLKKSSLINISTIEVLEFRYF